jgi:basic membrane protein A and related proteins
LAIISKRVVLSAIAAAGAVALLAGCGSAPKATSTSASAASKYLPCVVGDTGGFTDHSFNELALDGVTAAQKKIGAAEIKKVQSKTSDDYKPALTSLVAQGCNIILAPGFQFTANVLTEAKANPKVDFAQIDNTSTAEPNVKYIAFQTNEASFLGGYAAAAYSKTGKVATYGGANYPSVTIYMDGFYDGVQYYNKQKGKDVKVLGWDESKPKQGQFVGNFTDQNKSKQITQAFLDQGADVIVPVAGSLYQGAAAAITGSKSSAVLEGVDADIYQSDPKYASLMLVSILKRVDTASEQVVVQAASAKTFDNSTYVGTLKNGGVGLSSFHDYASKVPSTLSAELATIKAGIEAGTITAPTTAPKF